MRRHPALSLISVLTLLSLPACSSDDSKAGSARIRGEKGVVVVVATDLKFDKKEYTATAGEVRFHYIDEGAIPHTLLIEGVDGFKMEVKTNGSEQNSSVTLRPGTYTMYCDVVGHRKAGMHATLIVTPPPTTTSTRPSGASGGSGPSGASGTSGTGTMTADE